MNKKTKSYSFESMDLKVEDSELIQNYTDLKVYQLAFESAMRRAILN